MTAKAAGLGHSLAAAGRFCDALEQQVEVLELSWSSSGGARASCRLQHAAAGAGGKRTVEGRGRKDDARARVRRRTSGGDGDGGRHD